MNFFVFAKIFDFKVKNSLFRLVNDIVSGKSLTTWTYEIHEYRKHKEVRETVLASSYVAQVEFFIIKKWSKISWHCPFKKTYLYLKIPLATAASR